MQRCPELEYGQPNLWHSAAKFCLSAAKDKTYFMDRRQAVTQAHNFQSAFHKQVVLEGARSRNRMMKNQSTSWSASKTFLERLGRAWLIVRIARQSESASVSVNRRHPP